METLEGDAQAVGARRGLATNEKVQRVKAERMRSRTRCVRHAAKCSSWYAARTARAPAPVPKVKNIGALRGAELPGWSSRRRRRRAAVGAGRAARPGLGVLPPHAEPHRESASREAAEVQGRVADPRGGGGRGARGEDGRRGRRLGVVGEPRAGSGAEAGPRRRERSTCGSTGSDRRRWPHRRRCRRRRGRPRGGIGTRLGGTLRPGTRPPGAPPVPPRGLRRASAGSAAPRAASPGARRASSAMTRDPPVPPPPPPAVPVIAAAPPAVPAGQGAAPGGAPAPPRARVQPAPARP